MALPPQNPSDQRDQREALQQDALLREVDDALREDELLGFLRRYGKMLALVIVLGLGALGGYLWWDSSQKQAADERGEQMVKAIDRIANNHLKSADDELLKISGGGGAGTEASAKLLRAGIAIENGNRDKALKLFDEVANDSGAPGPFRDLATVRRVALDFDAMKPEDVVAKLKPLAVPGNPWFGVSGELLGMAYLRQDKPDLAGPLFASIAKDKDTTDSLRRRARQMAGALGVDAIEDPEKTLAESAVTE